MEDKTVLEKDTEKMAYNNKQSVMKGIEIAGFDYLRDVDERVSTMIYNYLMGKSDVLPTYEEVNALVESSGERNIISANCGVFLTKNFDISIYLPIATEVERVDYISKDEHVVDVVKNTKYSIGEEKIKQAKETVRFPEERVMQLQECLRSYVEKKEESKTKMF
ncbi:MAG: hypothetical protein IJG97_02590 [Bacilli bacterium]|nr:hypothetical protein [Bacilli bacterium]